MPHAHFKIRQATRADESRLVAHLMRHFNESGHDGDLIFHPVVSFAEEDFRSRLDKSWGKPLTDLDWCRTWILENESHDGHEILGHADLRSLGMRASLHRAAFGTGLERKARGQGFGRKLAETVLEWARKEPSLDWIDLRVFSYNAPARALYESLGFERCGEVRDLFRIKGESIDDIQMAIFVGERSRSLLPNGGGC